MPPRKIALVTGRKPAVIGNGAWAKPLSYNDALLLAQAPHLVLDGLNTAAAAASADNVFIYAPARTIGGAARPQRAGEGEGGSATFG